MVRVKAELQLARDDKVTEEVLFLVNKYIKVLEKMAVAPLSNKSEFQVGSGPCWAWPEAQTTLGLQLLSTP